MSIWYELILKERIRVNGSDGVDGNINIDTTVQEKSITFPSDAKRRKNIIIKCPQIGGREQMK